MNARSVRSTARFHLRRPRWAAFNFVAAFVVAMFALPSASLSPAVAGAAMPPDRSTLPASGTGAANGGVTPLDTPDVLVNGGVSDYTLAAPKVFWHLDPLCAPSRPSGAGPADQHIYEEIHRIPAYGGLQRQLFSHEVPFYSPGCEGGKTIDSNIVADADYVYWVSSGGLMRLSTNANVGDPPALLSNAVTGFSQLVIDTTYVYALTTDGSGNSTVHRVAKSDGTHLVVRVVTGGASNLQVDDSYLYWLTSNATLIRYQIGARGSTTLATGVAGYYPEGTRTICFIRGGCTSSQFVFFSQRNQVYRHNNLNDATANALVYTSDSPDPANVTIYDMVTDTFNLYVFESRQRPPCSGCLFGTYDDVLFRSGRGGGTPANLFISSNTVSPQTERHLTTDYTHLFWQDGGNVDRLPNNAATLPKTNMRVTGLEVTQGIQDTNNNVLLVQNKRTFVRVYVKSDDPSAAVSGVTATLNGTWDGGSGGPLSPENSVGSHITVQSSPNRNNVNDSFVFELPWDWTTKTNLRLTAHLNPYHVPEQTSYANNDLAAGPFTFKPSPRLQMQFISWGYKIGDTTYYPRTGKDFEQTYSWIHRAYPLNSTTGPWNDPAPGFHPQLWTIFDSNLGAKVYIKPQCSTEAHPENDADCDNLRASAYTDTRMGVIRTENGISGSTFFYGMISDAAGYFPRGQACCSSNVSTGPAGSGTWGWDFDGSYADWYAGHEIGHTLGRAHPTPNGYIDDAHQGCGHSRSDDSYPYPLAHIGPNSGILEGFDGGDYTWGISQAVYPGTTWFDVMSYCPNQWISDYTYKGMYDYMIAHPSQPGNSPMGVQAIGDYLSVFGTIAPSKSSADMLYLRHIDNASNIPPLVAGPYSIRLLDAQNATLADYPFTPDETDGDPINTLNFGQIVNFVAGTTQVQIVQLADGKVFATQAISAHPPVVNTPTLKNATNPVSGTVTLQWSASHLDNLPLTFDVLYSRDGGKSFQPLQLDVTGTSVAVDTSRLGGGTAIFRVVASDGSQSAHTDSAPFTMANKPPVVSIVQPADKTHLLWGQLLNLSGTADDAQDGGVSGAGLVWSLNGKNVGTGGLLTLNELPVGANQITLTATDSAKLTSSTTITVYVDDNLNLPGPTLTVAPSQLTFHVDPGTTTVQTATLTIDNAGSGTVSWTAASDSPWLTVNPNTGSAPPTSSITVSADPTGFAAGSIHTGTVTITMPANGNQAEQKVLIPVGLTVGAVIQPELPPPATTPIYIPIVAR